MRGRYAALFTFMVAVAVVHALIAGWTPIQGDDWNHWIWVGEHKDSGIGAFIVTHLSFSDAVSFVLARHRWFHTLVTPMVFVALVLGLYTVAMRRLPRATYDDLFGLALTYALLWLGQPSAGVTFFYTANTAPLVYGVTVAIWFIAPFRCGWTPRGAWLPVLAVAGYLAGTSTRAIATAALVGVIIALYRGPRARWMWVAFGGFLGGVLLGYAIPPWLEVPRVVRRGIDPNLVLLKLSFEEIGEIVSMVLAFYLLDVCLGALKRARAPIEERPETRDTLRWFIAWFATSIWCLFGPHYTEAMLLPATCMIAIAALPYLMWLARSRTIRILLVVLAVAVPAIAWSIALVKYHRFGREGAERLQILETTKPGEIAVIAPYSQTLESFWFMGEDLGAARLRQLIALEAFDLRSIDMFPTHRRMELDPDLQLELEVEGLTPEQLAAAQPPKFWASDVGAARRQFEQFVRRLKRIVPKPVARLVAKNVAMNDPQHRPLYAAWIDAKGAMIPRIARSPLDENSYYTIRIYGWQAGRFRSAWIIDRGTTTETPYRGGAPQLRPPFASMNVVVVCKADRCLVADAFVPRL